jgi:hypothetical protein
VPFVEFARLWRIGADHQRLEGEADIEDVPGSLSRG